MIMFKILHLISNSNRSPYFCAIADYADKVRFQVVVGTLASEGPLHEDMHVRGIRTFSLGCDGRSRYVSALLRLVLWLRRERVHILQTHLFDASFVGLMAARLARTPITIVTRHHSNAVALTGKRLAMLVDIANGRYLAHRIVVPSEKTKEFIVSCEKVPGEKIAVVPYGFDFEKIRSRRDSRRRVRKELSLNGSIVLATIARLDPLKGLAQLLGAISKLVPLYPNLRLLVIGDGPERQHLTCMRDSLGLSSHVIFAGYRSDVFDVISAADVVVHPSLSESFNQVIAEAAALAKPIVATDVGAAREVVEDGLSGFLVAPGDENQLFQALLRMLGNADRWKDMGEIGRLRVQKFSAERMVKGYEKHYIEWLGERGFSI